MISENIGCYKNHILSDCSCSFLHNFCPSTMAKHQYLIGISSILTDILNLDTSKTFKYLGSNLKLQN